MCEAISPERLDTDAGAREVPLLLLILVALYLGLPISTMGTVSLASHYGSSIFPRVSFDGFVSGTHRPHGRKTPQRLWPRDTMHRQISAANFTVPTFSSYLQSKRMFEIPKLSRHAIYYVYIQNTY